MARVEEHIVEWNKDGLRVRAWIAVDPAFGLYHDLVLLRAFCENLSDKNDRKLIANAVATGLPRVNAVEVTFEGNGYLIYPDWP